MSTSTTRRHYAAYASAGDHYRERGIGARARGALVRPDGVTLPLTLRDCPTGRRRPVSIPSGTHDRFSFPSGTHDRSPWSGGEGYSTVISVRRGPSGPSFSADSIRVIAASSMQRIASN